MFIKAILAKDVRARDVIRVNRICLAGRQFRVLSVFADEEIAWLYNETCAEVECSGIECQPDEIVGLVYRPYPEGKTKEDMRKVVEELASKFLMLREFGHDAFADKALEEFGEARDAYELGKSPEKK